MSLNDPKTRTPLVSIIIPSYTMTAFASCAVARENLSTHLICDNSKEWTGIVSR